ncbi:MAG: class I SAM-dependent methyltransferase [Pseudomonadota bacterium]
MKPKTMAEKADIHELYEESVQDVETEIDFVTDTFKHLRGRTPIRFREDFCGTASACCEWVKRDADAIAVGVDFDQATLEWGRENRLSRLSDAERSRVKLVEANVLTVNESGFDIVGAFNFSYWTFRTRAEMVNYFSGVYDALDDDGIFMLDSFGGSEAFEEMTEKTKHEGFTYVWDQAEYHPVTGYMRTHIHFKFPDGSRLKKAFTYEWRLWTLPEIQELLLEAGFQRATVYWEGEDDDGEGNGVYEPEAEGQADPGWIAYIVAEK